MFESCGRKNIGLLAVAKAVGFGNKQIFICQNDIAEKSAAENGAAARSDGRRE
jgi:hypothetical protein